MKQSKLLLRSLIVIFIAFSAPTLVLSERVAAAAIPTPAKAIIYGDSILHESKIVATSHFAKKKGWTYYFHAYPGFAPCDWLDELQTELVTIRPTVVTLETMGNSYTDCMKDGSGNLMPIGSQAWLDKYRSDLNSFFGQATAAGAKVVFANPLPASDSVRNGYLNQLMTVARAEAGKFQGVSISNVPRNSASKSGKFTFTKACLATETALMGCNTTTGQITVRNPDGFHLCPTPRSEYDFLVGCPVYSSGALRYGKAIVNTTVSPPSPIVP